MIEILLLLEFWEYLFHWCTEDVRGRFGDGLDSNCICCLFVFHFVTRYADYLVTGGVPFLRL